MARPPETMADLLHSVQTAAYAATTHVEATIATRHVSELGTSARVAATAYQAQALMIPLGIGNAKPGTTIPFTSQTDIWFRDMDHDGNYDVLASIVSRIARRNR